jgi:hypothetical protein
MTRPQRNNPGKMLLAAAFAWLAAAHPAAAEDAVHDQVQAFLNVIRDGGDFANSPFKDAVKASDVPRLRALVDCDLDSVKRSASGTSAIVLFSCPQAGGGTTSTAAMIMLSEGKAVSIEPMSFVRVPERG